MLPPNIILTGFMGCGKTTVGKLLAEELDYRFIDTDQLIEQKFGMTVPEIFSTHGEACFRNAEKQIAAELSKSGGQVISTGGGLMLDPENKKSLGASGRVVCLIATPEEIYRRISTADQTERPLLEAENPLERINELISERRKGYEQFHQIDTTGKSPGDIVQTIRKLSA